MKDGLMLPAEERKKNFEAMGADFNRAMTFTCNRGIAATAAFYGYKEFTKADVTMYDGSWMEW